MRTKSSSSGNGGFRARSRNTPRPRDHLQEEKAPIVILSAQTSAARRTCLLGRIDTRTQSSPAHVRIVYLD